MLFTLDQSGNITKSSYVPANCDSFDQHSGQFVVSGNRLVMREGTSRNSSTPKGTYYGVRIQLEIRSLNLLKGAYRWIYYHLPDGSTTAADYTLSISMQKVN